MGNAINFVKKEIPKTQSMSEEEAKAHLIGIIDSFIKERIVWADQAISTYGVSKIIDGDVILTYARYVWKGFSLSSREIDVLIFLFPFVL